MVIKIKQSLIVFLLLFFTVGCGNKDIPVSPTPSVIQDATAPSEPYAAYPAVDNQPDQSAGYVVPKPTIEGISPTIPDPEILFPDTDPNTGVIGGVLAREITGEGYVPVQPRQVILGRIIENDVGEQALISVAENAQRAQLFATGIFLFNQVPPGSYAVVIDLGFTQFPLLDENGQQILLEIEGGTTIDLGQILVELPEE